MLVDVADNRRQENIEQVQDVLREIEADDVPQLLIYNKIDLVEEVSPRIDRNDEGRPIRVWLSAQTGEGCELLLQAVGECLAEQMFHQNLSIPPKLGKLQGALYRLNAVQSENFDESGNWLLDIRIPMADWQRLKKEFGEQIEGVSCLALNIICLHKIRCVNIFCS